MKVRTIVKINLGLDIIRRREDGFHELESVFYPFDGFGDEVEIEPSESMSVVIDGPSYIGWNPDKDLSVRAYNILKEEFDLPAVSIRLHKTAPVGAGLGGGSADAVATLRLCNSLFGLGLNDSALEGFASRLGSDCPFFVKAKPVFASGRGEILEGIDLDLSAYSIRVEVPGGVAVGTAEAYASLDLPALREARERRGPLRDIISLPPTQWKNLLHNDFEPSIIARYPQIGELKRKMYEDGALYASMSGSGSAVYGIFAK